MIWRIISKGDFIRLIYNVSVSIRRSGIGFFQNLTRSGRVENPIPAAAARR
jgi:hypothetical protein